MYKRQILNYSTKVLKAILKYLKAIRSSCILLPWLVEEMVSVLAKHGYCANEQFLLACDQAVLEQELHNQAEVHTVGLQMLTLDYVVQYCNALK